MVVPGQRNLSFDDLILEIGNLLHLTSKENKGEKQEIRKSEKTFFHLMLPFSEAIMFRI